MIPILIKSDMLVWCWYDKRWASIGWPISGGARGYGKTMTRSNPAESINHTSCMVVTIIFWLGSVESEWGKWGSATKVDFESSCLFLLAASCKWEVGDFLFLQRKVFNQISPNRWLTNSLLDKQRTLRILNVVCCHIWIRKGDILKPFFYLQSSNL